MEPFLDREQELKLLDQILKAPGSQFVMVYGRRRVGKTTLLTTWASRTGVRTFYWVAKREARETLMANLARHAWGWAQGGEPPEVAVRPADWEQALQILAQAIGSEPCIVILDEVPYILESDPAFASYLQATWDQHLRRSQARVFLCGSHIGMMTQMLEHQAPLYGRFTGQLPVQPLSFPDIAPFLPGHDVEKRLAVYSILGGIPAYLERWQSSRSLAANIEQLFLQRTGWFRNEPLVLVSDLTQRETGNYEAILRAIAGGAHQREDVAAFAAIPTTSLSHYLPRLLDLQLIERRLPATLPPEKRRASHETRYFLRDPYLRFYYRFVDPNLHLIEQGLSRRLWESMQANFRAFVAETFEDLCRSWTLAQARAGQLPFEPEIVGSHWSAQAQVDVVAVDWKTKQILLGEAKWGGGLVGREIIRELVDKAPKVVPGQGGEWRIHYAFFARRGVSVSARSEAERRSSILIALPEMERDLRSDG